MAADLDEQAWMVGVEHLPGNFDFTLTAPNGTYQGVITAESVAVVGGWRGTFASPGQAQGLLIQCEGAVSRASFGDGSFQAGELRAGLGWAYALDRRWTVWTGVRGVGGIGTLSGSDSYTQTRRLTGTGWGWLAGVGGTWTYADSWAITSRVDWRAERWTLSDSDNTMHLNGAGLVVGLGLEWRPSWKPRRLE